MKFSIILFCLVLLGLGIVVTACEQGESIFQEQKSFYYPSSKPCIRWWWFASEIKKEGISKQLDWAQAQGFGGVEISWVYPLYRYQAYYKEYWNGRFYPKDTTAQKWLSPEWTELMRFTKAYADSIGMSLRFQPGLILA